MISFLMILILNIITEQIEKGLCVEMHISLFSVYDIDLSFGISYDRKFI